jgi:hypothetical protein
MSARELVMAVLCKPLSVRELLQTEKANNVIIHRKMEYEPRTDRNAIEDFMKHIKRLPVKLMFIFSLSDIIIVNNAEDLNEVSRRLLAL